MSELNEKLARWAGFREWVIPGWWIFPNEPSRENDLLPDFTDPDYGIAYCFKWLVPKVEHFHYIAIYIVRDAINEPQPIMWDACVSTYEHIEFARAETPTLALCKAIEKLIDKGGK